MQIILNGKVHTLEKEATLQEVIQILNYNSKNYAVAVNMEVVPRNRYHQLWLQNNDKVEIITAFQGG